MKNSRTPRWLEDAREPDTQALRRSLDEAPRFVASDVRRRRVWARVEDPKHANRSARRAFALGALVASALGVVTLLSVDLLRPALAPVRAPAIDSRAGRQRASNVASRPVPTPAPTHADETRTQPPAQPPTQPPTDVLTARGQPLVRKLARGAEAELQTGSRLAISQDPEAAPEVQAGRVTFKVAHQPVGRHFEVRAGAFKVIVVGTRFVVDVEGPGVSVSVLQGVVEIWGSELVARLGPGQQWSNGQLRSARAPSRVSMLPAAPPGSARTAPVAARAPDLQPPAATWNEELIAARAARAAPDPRRALAIYQRLTERGGPVAENALYEIGAIHRDQLGEPRRALAAWERYRSRYPAGLLRAEADLSIIDTLTGLGESRRALKEARAFLRRYPRSERRAEIARIADDAARQLEAAATRARP